MKAIIQFERKWTAYETGGSGLTPTGRQTLRLTARPTLQPTARQTLHRTARPALLPTARSTRL